LLEQQTTPLHFSSDGCYKIGIGVDDGGSFMGRHEPSGGRLLVGVGV